MPEFGKPMRCIAHPGCQFPNCFCKPEPPQRINQFRDKVDTVVADLQRTSIALSQFKEDLKEAELENQILHTGIERLISKYTKKGFECDNLSMKLAFSIVIKDLETVISVSRQSSTDILVKTQNT